MATKQPPFKALQTDVQVWGPCFMLRRLGVGGPMPCPSMPLNEGCAPSLARVGRAQLSWTCVPM